MHVYFGQWRVSRSLLGWSCVHTTDARHCFFVINRVKTLVWGTLNSQTNIVTTCTWFLKMFYHTVYIKPLGLFLHCNLLTTKFCFRYIYMLARNAISFSDTKRCFLLILQKGMQIWTRHWYIEAVKSAVLKPRETLVNQPTTYLQ